MKKVLFLAIIAFALTSCGELKIPVAEVTGNVQDYPYVYVVPTSAVRSSAEFYRNEYRVYFVTPETTNRSKFIS